MAEDYKERQLQKAFIASPSDVLKGSSYVAHEFRLYPALELLQRDMDITKTVCIGRIDLVFMYKQRKYAAEIKYLRMTNNDFWDALKIIGYTEYYKWQVNDRKVHPAIIIPRSKIRLEHQVVAGKLNLALFGVEEHNNKFKMTYIEDRPIWRQ